jgi:glyoxylase-like metal-dependent hydrolase (beta-lactamase superfamily II)
MIRVPVQCVHIKLGDVSLLVDAAFYDLDSASEMVPPGYQPPPGLIAQLANVGVQPETITDIAITHAHFDHYNGLAQKRDGQARLTFPNARCYLGQGDWARPELQQALQDPNSMESLGLGRLHRQGALTLVEGNLDLGPGLQIIAAPGETPGHQMVRVQSEGQTLYCLGDLYHHPLEFEQLSWTVTWADVEANRASRQALIEAALAENALLVATHIPAIYRLERVGAGLKWVMV